LAPEQAGPIEPDRVDVGELSGKRVATVCLTGVAEGDLVLSELL
jgi:hypothetical protein